MKNVILIVLSLVLIKSTAKAVGLSDNNLIPQTETSLLLPNSTPNMLQSVRGSNVSGFRYLAYALGFTGGAVLGYGLVPLITGNTGVDGSHNTFILIGAGVIALSIPVAIIADKEDAIIQKTEVSWYKKYKIQRELCFVANRNGIGVALNF